MIPRVDEEMERRKQEAAKKEEEGVFTEEILMPDWMGKGKKGKA